MSNVTFEFETPEGQKRAVVIPAENIKTTGIDGQTNPILLVAAVLISMDTRIRGLEQAQEMRLNALEFRLEDLEARFNGRQEWIDDMQAGLDETDAIPTPPIPDDVVAAPDIHNV